jgi:hypothetical protein
MTKFKNSEDLTDTFRYLINEFINILKKLDEDEIAYLKSVKIDIELRTIRIKYRDRPRFIGNRQYLQYLCRCDLIKEKLKQLKNNDKFQKF